MGREELDRRTLVFRVAEMVTNLAVSNQHPPLDRSARYGYAGGVAEAKNHRITVDDELYQLIRREVKDLLDTPNKVLRRLLKLEENGDG